MPATSKTYSAQDDAHVASGTFAQREEEAISGFLEKIDHMLAVVVAALVVCIGFIAFGSPARPATQAQQMQNEEVQRITGDSHVSLAPVTQRSTDQLLPFPEARARAPG
jgi:hypothetical protein